MNVSSFVFEQALKQLGIPAAAIRQLQIAGQLSDVEGSGFPAELFQLSAPMVTRGLLNYAVLQMKRDWLYPHWVHQQLDPKSESFVARSQNPLLINITQRNWTLLGSPSGFHEAIVDPRGLVTPLPREWSIDVWLVTEKGILLPSQQKPVHQEYDTQAPRIITRFEHDGHELSLEAFVDPTNHGIDVLFHRIHIVNRQAYSSAGLICIAVRPFNPEGVVPIQHIEYRSPRYIYIDRCLGIVLAEDPQWVTCSNADGGDALKSIHTIHASGDWNDLQKHEIKHSITCRTGLANAVAVFPFSLSPGEDRSLHYSVALGVKSSLNRLQPKSTWRVSFDRRLEHQQARWVKERTYGAQVQLADERLQNIFDANVLTLLQLHDSSFISPGPYLYHHFWFRDAAPMVHALDRLGFHRRARQVIDSLPERQTSDGFFKGPEGEWDSNGEVLWLLEQHMNLTHSTQWLKNLLPNILQAGNWIIKKRNRSTDSITSHRGLMPPSLSAEHLGMVDQYYWDSFWALAGIHSVCAILQRLHQKRFLEKFEKEEEIFKRDIQLSLEKNAERLERSLIPASPSRSFDESAIGSICGIYPLSLVDIDPPAFQNTLDELANRFVNDKGFYHPYIHSGYNPYLTFHIAHAYLRLGKSKKAWEIAETIFHQCKSPYSLPEAIHPKTGGGAMGDGHHGWAAAEIILFLLDCLVSERNDTLSLFKDAVPEMTPWGVNVFVKGISTSFGKVSCSLNYETGVQAICTVSIEPISENKPATVELNFPFSIKRALTATQGVDIHFVSEHDKTRITSSSGNAVLLLER